MKTANTKIANYMIHPALNKSEIARRYYTITTGEALTKVAAWNRLRVIRKPDKKVLQRIADEIHQEWKEDLKASLFISL